MKINNLKEKMKYLYFFLIVNPFTGIIVFVLFINSIIMLFVILKEFPNINYRQGSSFAIIVLLLLFYYLNVKLISKETDIEDIKDKCKREIEECKREIDKTTKRLDNEYRKKEDFLNKREKELDEKYIFKDLDLNIKEKRLKNILSSSNPFSFSSSLRTDIEMKVFDNCISYLKNKSHPAKNASETLKDMKKETKKYISMYYDMLYKYEYLLGVFPELSKYVEDEESLLHLSESENYNDFKDNRDIASDYLSKEEWLKLDTDERNQLALDRYKKKEKSNWVIGIEYEMYIDYILRNKGFKTIPHGSIKGINDLGRDIIAFKQDSNNNTIAFIIQCKNYSDKKNKLIHENVVFQIFGTSIEYKFENNEYSKVIPVIYSTVSLSERAMLFANQLGVQYYIVKKGDYPMIKCNINNNGEKIYHLPFDQQYYKTEIKNSGEFYAWTVKEAVSNGFRRAFKYQV